MMTTTRISRMVLGLAVVSASTLTYAKEDQVKKSSAIELKTDKQKASYGIGQRIGRSMKAQGVDVDVDVLAASIQDALAGNPSRLKDEEIDAAMGKLQEGMEKKMAELAKQNKESGEKYLAEAKKKKDVKSTASGLLYKVVKEGKGESPKEDAKVKVHYRGTLLDGTEFDSSYKRNEPAVFPVNGVIAGWTEALKMMKPGAKWELTIPAELAYGSRGTPGIPPNSVLNFEVELLEIVDAGKPAADKKGSQG